MTDLAGFEGFGWKKRREMWVCTMCTVENEDGVDVCVVCYARVCPGCTLINEAEAEVCTICAFPLSPADEGGGESEYDEFFSDDGEDYVAKNKEEEEEEGDEEGGDEEEEEAAMLGTGEGRGRGQWECEECEMLNSDRDVMCEMCHAPRGRGEGYRSEYVAFVPAGGGECLACGEELERRGGVCRVCGFDPSG